MISMDKKYKTRNGRDVRILCVDGPEPYPIIGITDVSVLSWTAKGSTYTEGEPHKLDLIEVNEWDDFQIDEPVMVSHGDGNWIRRYFAGVECGVPMTWLNGSTSWSSKNTTPYEQCRRPTPEELGVNK